MRSDDVTSHTRDDARVSILATDTMMKARFRLGFDIMMRARVRQGLETMMREFTRLQKQLAAWRSKKYSSR